MKTFCLHGLSATALSLRLIIEELDDAYTIEFNSHQDLDKTIAHIRQVIEDFIEPGEQYNLIGHSLGGLIACHLAMNNDQVNKVVTIASPLGGSKAAYLLRWLVVGSPVLCDLVPSSRHIRALQGNHDLEMKSLSIIATGGGWSVLGEPNDNTVTIDSQKALNNKHVEVMANHTEVLLSDETLNAIKEFL